MRLLTAERVFYILKISNQQKFNQMLLCFFYGYRNKPTKTLDRSCKLSILQLGQIILITNMGCQTKSSIYLHFLFGRQAGGDTLKYNNISITIVYFKTYKSKLPTIQRLFMLTSDKYTYRLLSLI
jgi:hypothetical protein